MSLRIRNVKPTFWSDAKLARIPLDVRLFYIGLWQTADDDGWFEWEAEQIAMDLRLRETFVRRAMAVLVESERVRLHDCGHGEVPHLTEHQRLPVVERRVTTTHRQHLSNCFQPIPNGSNPFQRGGKGREGIGREGEPTRLHQFIQEVTDPDTGRTVWTAPEAKP